MKLKEAILGVVIVAGLTIAILIQHASQAKLRDANASLHKDLAQLQLQRNALSDRITQMSNQPSLGSERLRELLRLRGEISVLRRQQRELELARTDMEADRTGALRQATTVAKAQAATPAPFQLQVVLSGPGTDSDTLTNVSAGLNAEPLYVQKTPVLDHTAISSAVVKTDASTGTAQIDVEFNDLGRELFAAVTKENINKRLAIVLDGQLYAAPMIRSEITDGKASVTGSFTPDEANALAAKINQAVATR